MHQKRALIVHPDRIFCNRIKSLLEGSNCRVETECRRSELKSSADAYGYHLIVVDDTVDISLFRKPPTQEFGLRHQPPVILFADKADVRKAVKVIQDGAFDYLTKNSPDSIIQETLQRAIAISGEVNPDPDKTSAGYCDDAVIAVSTDMQHLLETAKRVAPANATVLIQGESGTGKEIIARFIHRHSMRCHGPFIAMNCAALPENLAESELFGYEKGAFTGATQSRCGKFEQSQGGTLLLDEISEMPLSLQVKLLRVLQEKEVDHIGGRKPIPVDVRVIATSNRDLAKMVKEGSFRDDLYYRLRVIPLTIPPLRARKADIPSLVDHFAKKYGRLHKNCDVQFAPQALDQLVNWPWPGNVRELENTVERAVLISQEHLIGQEDLMLDQDIAAADSGNSRVNVGMTVKEMEQKLISKTLEHVNDNRTHAAKILGISIRTLRNKLREYEDAELNFAKTAEGK